MTTLTSPHDLLAAVPFFIGYHPTDSLVLIALRGQELGMAMRVDFPEDSDPDQIDTIASHMVREKADATLLVAYLPEEIMESDYLMTPLREALEMRGIKVRECLEVRNKRWRSLLCTDDGCCPPQGNPLPPLEESRVAAEAVAMGNPLPYANLAELGQSIASQDEDPELLKYINQVQRINYDLDDFRTHQRQGALALNDLIAEFLEKGISTNKPLIAEVLVRMTDVQVRDYAMGLTHSGNIEQLFAMWRWLVTIAPHGYLAPVATLFATVAYEHGDGALAHRALDRALDDDPKYPMSMLLRKVFAAGWSPENLATMRQELHPKICQALFGE